MDKKGGSMYKSLEFQPKKRSAFRVFLGTGYYRAKRYLEWLTTHETFAKTKEAELKQHVIHSHRTPLYRKLKDVDMWYQENKVKNLRIAVRELDKIIIKPGETFSYWKLLGNTTKRKGYVEGMVLYYGSFKPGLGGGLCQLSNLIYWMTLHTPLTVTERHRHSYDVFPDSNRRLPFGSGATCAYNYLDLKIKNTTTETFQLHVYLTDEALVGEWRAAAPALTRYEVYEKEHRISQEYWGGYLRHNQIFRKVFNRTGAQIDDEFITENHALMMYEPLLEQKTGSNS
ncbi:vancomycin resistance protein VanW [[Bacillus] enclensis]|uniref:Vancomycin resistance protein VanW n=1 Tax=[Bacillus] enclensis TaxID=1402860 RepID=A0A1C4CFG8_9BACI|nr:VanW family protein [[Bacillus] enclensis]SCC17832.1 vancomycin resistance protein VanW [[Bacillus] enclensis]